MKLKEKLKKTTLLAAICVVIAFVAAGCGQQGTQGNKDSIASDLPGAAPESAHHSRFTPIKPDMAQASAFNYKVYEFANDGSWISIVPMPPRAGDVVIHINAPGDYDVKLENGKCASSVKVLPSEGLPIDLSNNNPKYLLTVKNALQLTIAMSENAPNNYFCNVAVALSPK